MSHASFMEKLLKGVEVEWKALGEVGQVRMCKRILKNQTSTDDEIPFYKIGTFGKEPDAYIPQKLFEEYKAKYNYPKVGEILISASGTIGRAVIFDGKDAYFQDSNIVWIENNEIQVLNKYLFYFYQIANWGIAEGGTIQRLYNENLRKLQIPIPPLNIQTEIIRILDAFTVHTTELRAELTAELTARKKQYNYYRDHLLTFEEAEVEWKTLGELCSINVGQAPNGNVIGEYPFVNAGTTPSGYLSTYNTEPDTITTPSRGQGGIGYVGYQTSRFWCGPLCYRICSTNKIITTRFLYYVLSNSMINIIGLANMAGVPALKKNELFGFPVPIPPLTEKARIVAILDKFDALTHSITEGLPREIALRQQQYAYYRDLLLRFPKAVPETPLESVENQHG